MNSPHDFQAAIEYARQKMNAGSSAPTAVYLAASTFRLDDHQCQLLSRTLGV